MRRCFALLTALLVLASCAPEKSESPPSSVGVSAEESPLEQIYDYRLVESVGGVVQWILDSQKMQKFEGRDNVELFNIEVEFFDENGPNSVLKAQRGRVNQVTNELFVWQDVVLTTERGWVLETTELYYDSDRELIYNDVFDRFTRGGDWVTGYGLEATPDLEYIEIQRQTESEVSDEARADGGNR